MSTDRPILFYDGDCALCDRSVRFFLRHDRRRILRFAPLQGTTYAALPAPSKPTALDTMVLSDSRGLHTRSDAVLRALTHIRGPWRPLATAARLIPRPLRDHLYNFIAARRHKWFGGHESCRLPSLLDRGRLLP